MWELRLADILREVLVAGGRRDWDKVIELAQELEELARSRKAPGADEYPGDGDGSQDANPR
ncbi:hypothetical protein ES703_117418 [subsurface metagenome]